MAVEVTTTDYPMFIDGASVAVDERALAGGPQPGHARAGRSGAGRDGGRRRPRGRGGPRGIRGRPLAPDGDARAGRRS